MILILIFAALKAVCFFFYQKAKANPLKVNRTGGEIAEKMSPCVVGYSDRPTNYFDPAKKIIHLNTNVYFGENTYALSVGAHEAGHSLQRPWLKKIPKQYNPFILGVFGFLLIFFPEAFYLMFFLSITYKLIVVLPPEINASERAIAYLKPLISKKELRNCKKILLLSSLSYIF